MSERETPEMLTRDATITVTLCADSGYEAHEEHRISADQWWRICEIMNEPEILARIESSNERGRG